MPFFLIPSALGICFFLIWAFIGGMIFRDSQLAVQHERESNVTLMTLPRRHVLTGPKARRRVKRRQYPS